MPRRHAFLWRQDARAPLAQLQVFYTQLVLLVRQLYQECRLVHADLSEYNILVHQARPLRAAEALAHRFRSFWDAPRWSFRRAARAASPYKGRP